MTNKAFRNAISGEGVAPMFDVSSVSSNLNLKGTKRKVIAATTSSSIFLEAGPSIERPNKPGNAGLSLKFLFRHAQ